MRKTGYFPVVALLVLAAALGASCAAPAMFAKDSSFSEPMPAFEVEAAERYEEARSAPAPAPGGRAVGGSVAPAAEAVTADQPVDRTSPDQPQERLRVYSGDLDLGVSSVEHARDTIIDIAQNSGGYVESSQGNFIVIRIPASSFDGIFADIEELGTVRSRAVRTADVTDQFFDLQRRLEIALSARDRLNLLLERSSDADERVSILREIRRLTEEIERLRAAFDSLAQLIAYSRISVRLTSLIAEVPAGRSRIPFPWIAALSPLYPTTHPASTRIAVEIPESFAVFGEDRFVTAEAADGTKIRIGSVANDPAGDDQFWARALAFHLGPFYLRATPVELGNFRGVILESKDRDPYHYTVAVAVAGDELIVVEVFYPDAEALSARSGDIAKMLQEVRP